MKGIKMRLIGMICASDLQKYLEKSLKPIKIVKKVEKMQKHAKIMLDKKVFIA